MTSPFIIVGGGITGLSASYQFQQLGLPYVLFEASDQLGGKIHTEHTPDGFLVEKAADAFILGKPYAAELARELGLEPEVIYPREDTKKLYFLQHGQLLDFPPQLKMFVPLEDESFLRSGVLSPEGARRFLDEQHVPPKPDDGQDESLQDFVVRRFGHEALNFIVPMAAGIYVANPAELSMRATFPQFLALEQQYGSVIRGSRATPRAQGPIFMSFRGGMGQFVQALASQLSGPIHLNQPVLRVHQDGVTLANGQKVKGQGVLLALPAWYAAPTLADFAQAAQLVGQLRANSSVAVVLAYSETATAHASASRPQAPNPHHMHGLLVSPAEGLPMTAITVHSSKMHGRAPQGQLLMRVFFKDIEPAQARAFAVAKVRELFGIQEDPLWHAYGDWRGKNPAYLVGHLQHLASIRAALPAQVQVAGASFTGVGIPDCVHAGRSVARALAVAGGGAFSP